MEFIAVIAVWLLWAGSCAGPGFDALQYIIVVLIWGCFLFFLLLCCWSPHCAVLGDILRTAMVMHRDWQMVGALLLFLCCCTGHAGTPVWAQVKGTVTCGWVHMGAGYPEASLAMNKSMPKQVHLEVPMDMAVPQQEHPAGIRPTARSSCSRYSLKHQCSWGRPGAPEIVWLWINPGQGRNTLQGLQPGARPPWAGLLFEGTVAVGEQVCVQRHGGPWTGLCWNSCPSEPLCLWINPCNSRCVPEETGS